MVQLILFLEMIDIPLTSGRSNSRSTSLRNYKSRDAEGNINQQSDKPFTSINFLYRYESKDMIFTSEFNSSKWG